MATVLILDKENRIREPLRKILAGARNLTTADAESEIQALRETERLHPRLVILNLLISIDKLSQLVQQFREIIPGLPVFLFVDKNDTAAERQALSCGVTAVFSAFDEPSSILANVQAVCGE